MKKVILSAAALMFGAVAFAQTSGSAGNNPVPQETNATAAGVVSKVASDNGNATTTSNAGEAHQEGNDNFIKLRQAGTDQSAYFMQENGLGTGGNNAYVRQTGEVQPESGFENLASVYQSGTANGTTIRQEGDINEAITDQTGSENIAYVRQGTGEQAEDNFAAIKQDGIENQSVIQQTYDNSSAFNDQSGDGNFSSIMQNANPDKSNGHSANVVQREGGQISYVDQNGSNGHAGVDQDGAGLGGINASEINQTGQVASATSPMEAYTTQSGDGNSAELNQTALGAAAGMFGQVIQIGDDNQGRSNQTGEGYSSNGIYQMGGNNDAQIDQVTDAGGFNYAVIDQGYSPWLTALPLSNLGSPSNLFDQAVPDSTPDITVGSTVREYLEEAGGPNSGSFNGLAFIDQEGASNIAEAYQLGADEGESNGNYSKQTQDGVNNKALVAQNAYGATNGNSNNADQVQGTDDMDVFDNEATIGQNGIGHAAYQIQLGDNNQAIALQRGTTGGGHISKTEQWGDASYAFTAQRGAGINEVQVVQYDGQSFIGLQNSMDPSSSTGGNYIESLQVGPNGDLGIEVDCTLPGEMGFDPINIGAGTVSGPVMSSFCADCE